ncbi:MAG TPA: TonB-dependent receptor [Candidatus Binatia bacterium]|nr:TonB-dependent receptor [Candidatus Binatia bacterium]
MNETYCPGDRIQVGDKSRADVQLINQPVLRLDQNSLITLAGLKDQRASIIDVARGALHFFSRLPRNLEINTAFVNAGVEGTEGLVRVEKDRTLISVFDGRVFAVNAQGSLPVASGQSAEAVRGQGPVLRTVVRPRDAVQWALYYPPVAYFRPEDFRGAQPWEAMVRSSLEAYTKGDYQGAFDRLVGAPANIAEPRFFAYRAQLLLGVGRVDEAGQDIEQAIKLNPRSADALALQAVIAVVHNDKERALGVAQKAVGADPKSAAALTSLSYAQQASFDLEGARLSLTHAVEAEPNNALAWARLAEIHASFSELDKSLEAAQKAVSLDPNLSRTQMVLGFAYLTQVNTTEAKKAFEKAIELDPADYLSRLGLGLAKIREGALDEGGKEIEVAASLNPNNSLVRSYLGKTYYEQKRTGLDVREYAIAKELDPKDPTPWFYDAIAKQTTNRPVEALQDMQKAIELNDNRAVYRSQLLLDSDMAARSAALGRIYGDLGFQQLALVEGWKSVNTDPTNYSAHRFLADSYSVLPRHQIARVSELLQSQLLQPINITPVQPRLAESNLFQISSQGPGALSFNEFNALFHRNQIAFQTSGLAGQRDTFAGEGVLSGIYNKASFSIGGFHFKTDGWRDNADQKDTIGNAFLQFELTPKLSVQAEYRYRRTRTGDLELNFFPDDFRPNFALQSETFNYRAGLRYALSPNSIFLASWMYQHTDSGLRDRSTLSTGFPFPFDLVSVATDLRTPNQQGVSSEFQHLYRSPSFNLTSGVGYFKVQLKSQLATETSFPNFPFLPPFASQTTAPQDVKHTNLYLYSHVNALKNVTLILGASGDFYDTESGSSQSTNQFNPKVGVTWNPLPDTTLRAAAFRVLKRTLITNQTLEPSQVAGFNQFFDDVNGTRAWRYGVAVDQKFSPSIFGGMEFSIRDLSVPINVVGAGVQRSSGREYLTRPYFFLTPHPWLALSAEYQYARFARDQLLAVATGSDNLTTQRVPLGLRFFHPSGFSAMYRPTYFNQSGQFMRRGASAFTGGQSSFWTIDAAVSYRFPQRYGFITVGATNLFDTRFKYQETDFSNATIQPRRTVFASVTLALP